MRRACVVLLTGWLALLPAAAATATTRGECGTQACVTTGYDGLLVSGTSRAAGAGVASGRPAGDGGGGGKPTDRFDYDVEPACTPASPGAGIGCVGATTACPPGSTRFFLYRRPAGTTQTFGRFGPAACLPVGPDGTQ